MKTVWENDFGEEFETEEEAHDNLYERMELDDYLTRIGDRVDVQKLLRWAWRQGGFYEAFYDEIVAAEDSFFEENYREVQAEDNEEDE